MMILSFPKSHAQEIKLIFDLFFTKLHFQIILAYYVTFNRAQV